MLLCILLLPISILATNLNCADSSCSSCTSGYLFNSVCCLLMCPTGYTQSSAPNTCALTTTTSPTPLFTLNFFSLIDLTASTLGDFSTITSTPFNTFPSSSAPLPTKSQGFYFTNGLSLKSTQNWVLSPAFTLNSMVRLISYGVIFEVDISSTPVLTIEITGECYFVTAVLTSSSTGTSSSQTSHTCNSKPSAYTSWVSLQATASQLSIGFQISFPDGIHTFAGYELQEQSASTNYYVGASASTTATFTGFVYMMEFYNSVVSGFYMITPPYKDNSQQYSDSGYVVHACSTGCPSGPWCVRGSDCGICFAESCGMCTGYSLAQCTSCVGTGTVPECGAIGLNCATGGVFSCTVCSGTYYLTGGLCINTPSGTLGSSDPFVDIDFSEFEQYYGERFYSGASDATYSPYNSPESDDPIAVSFRGLYFNGSMKLTSTTIIALNYELSISFWSLSSSLGIIFDSSYLQVYSFSCASLTLSNPQDTKWVTTGECTFSSYAWVFTLLSLSFSTDVTSAGLSINNGVSSTISFSGYAFYDSPSIPLIGPTFTGFLTGLTLWQTASVSSSSQYDICGSGQFGSCLWTCGLTSYFNSYLSQCEYCDDSCTSGCGTWGSCNACISLLCSSCTSYSEVCSVPSTSAACLGDLIFSSFSGKCCPSYCSDCLGPESTDCLTCSSGYIYGSGCVASCPSGYSASSSGGMCCLNPCADCLSDLTNCISCIAGYYLYDCACVQECPTGYTASTSGICCELPCSDCSSSSPATCTACIDGYTYSENTCTLASGSGSAIADCDTAYTDSVGITTCVTCTSPNLLPGSTCACDCSSGYQSSSAAGICCDISCDDCTGSSTACSPCSHHYIPYGTICRKTAPTGYTLDGKGTAFCLSPCSDCNSIGHCTQCAVGYYLHGPSCVSVCPSGYSSSTAGNLCCASPCGDCYNNLDECLACVSGYYYFGEGCLKICPYGYTGSSSSNMCCISPCDSCSGSPSTCLSCISGYYLYESFCINPCPSGYSADPFSNICCMSPCLTCSGTSISCASCISGYYLYESVCSTTCPLGYSAVIGLGICCTINCASCSTTSPS